MYLIAAQRLINFVCSVCHVRWARGCPRQHICSKYLKNRWRYYGKLKKKKRMQRPVITDTHMCLFYIYLYTSNKLSNAGCFVITYPQVSAIIPEGGCVNIRRRNARRQRVPRPRASNAACAAEVYNDHITDIYEVTRHRGSHRYRWIARCILRLSSSFSAVVQKIVVFIP